MSNSDLILKDNFTGMLNRKIWTSAIIDPKTWSITNEGLKVTNFENVRAPRDKEGVDRSELSEREDVMISPGENIWYSFSFYFPMDFLIINNRLVFAQWKQYAPHFGSPFLSARYIDGKLSFKITAENLVKKFNKKVDLRGEWHSIMLNYKLKLDQTGHAQAWLDQEEILNYEGKMDYYPAPKLIFFKMGLYRDTIKENQTIYFNRFRRGPTKESVLD